MSKIIINYSTLIKDAINKIEGDCADKLNSLQKKLLKELARKLSPLLQNLLEKTIKTALRGEDYKREFTEELIYKACKEDNLRSSIIKFYKILEDFEMTSNVVLAISNLSQIELSSLTHWLQDISPEKGKEIIKGHENVGKELVFLFTIIIENAYKIAKTPVIPEADITEGALIAGKIVEKSAIGEVPEVVDTYEKDII